MSDDPDWPSDELDLLTPNEVADLLRVPRRTVERMAWAGERTAFKFHGRTIRFHRRDVIAFVRANTRRLTRADRAVGGEHTGDD